MFNAYQGDPAIDITEQGATMKFVDGQPVMDQGFENYVQIALFTKRGYWGNTLEKDDNKKIGSDFEQERTIIDVTTINNVTTDAENALKRMLETGLASEITVEVTNPTDKRIDTRILIKPPGFDETKELLFTRNGINWINQSRYPANERF
jgi:phage gp46-like protein